MLRIKQISLVGFKNYEQATFRFDKRIIGICGNNGVGKTNLLDALYYLCFTKSYFARGDQANVLRGAPGFRIEGHIDNAGQNTTVVCILRENGKKEFLTDGQPYEKLSRHIGRFPCVIIAPDDIQIITGGSEERRRFLDALLSQLNPDYLQNLIDYNRVLQQRNSFLKSVAETRLTDKHLLEVYDEQLVAAGTTVFQLRRDFLQQLLPLAGSYYTGIAGAEEPLSLGYESQLLHTPLRQLLRQGLEKDLYLQRTGSGIHKDDIDIRYADEPFRARASQGQRKSLLFALKLAEYETLKKAKGWAPLLLLDDVFEKLDRQRMRNLLERVCRQDDGQLFITDTHPERIRQEMEELGVGYQLISLPADTATTDASTRDFT
ncbi:DNA replication/repair protein RecF [Puia dinghuensis]|uniref:DNA replication and repair protein RecF n=1 Tax=Puia dinghuensis TaxID=1792502 RepID=A0A8J2XQ70_9BACT|nr:DNA replication and repair protein RecF [Puia dinghuensis]GGA83526.1 DNA replication and repair protein RecF [Puia dinghuensis]